MATWKEKGVVPDSDDEDSLESQETTSNDHDIDDPQNEEPPASQEPLENEARTVDNHTTRPDALVAEASSQSSVLTELEITPNATEATAQVDEVFTERPNRRVSSPSSSPAFQREFKVPEPFWDYSQPIQDSKERVAGTPKKAQPVEDDISRSYVRISSPSSPFPSPLGGSQPWPTPNIHKGGQITSPKARKDVAASQVDGRSVSVQQVDISPDINPPRRALRQRNPIQVHPYLIEQEKYQQTMKARGVPATKIATTEETARRSRNTASPDPDSQEPESQELFSQTVEPEEQESQSRDFQPEDVLSSSPPTMKGKNYSRQDFNDETTAQTDDEDEFPDIEALLKETRTTLTRTTSKLRLKSYSKKTKKAMPSKAPIPSAKATRHSGFIGHDFDILASPPATSSPFASTNFRGRSSLSRALSNSSKESVSLGLTRGNFAPSGATKLPTPLTSAIKPVSEAILVDSDSGPDPFASDMEESVSSSSSSSSDESVLIRKVGKKFRGVLPASHLRLEQKKKAIKDVPPPRQSMSMSPVKGQPRRGVALPRTQTSPRDSAPPGNALGFLSGGSDEEESQPMELYTNDLIEDSAMDLDNLFDESRQGYAAEDDRVDIMLPSRKRQSTSSRQKPWKKRRLGPTLFQDGTREPYRRQPKITEHLDSHNNKPRGKDSKRLKKSKPDQAQARRARPTTPPRLSILDVSTLFTQEGKRPRFVRIAARAAKRRKSQGKQTPSRKFIKLATREDTHDAQVVLEDWRAGRIQPRTSDRAGFHNLEPPRNPLQQVQNNRQTRLPPPTSKTNIHGGRSNVEMQATRKLVVARPIQRSMKDFVIREDASRQQMGTPLRRDPDSAPHLRSRAPLRHAVAVARPAQLESLEVGYSNSFPNASFKNTKRILDHLHQASRRRPIQQRNIPLSRFLADEATSTQPEGLVDPGLDVAAQQATVEKINKKTKRPPKRLDASAALYRQPNNPLILDFLLQPENTNLGHAENKLSGLGAFGTNYTFDFDVFPLLSGTFFHSSTFIGAGHLAGLVNGMPLSQSTQSQPFTYFKLGSREFSWGRWDDRVSSEVGICFDWVADQLIVQHESPLTPPGEDPLGIVSSMSNYLQHHLNLKYQATSRKLLARFLEVVDDVSHRLEQVGSFIEQAQLKQLIRVSAMCTIIMFQLLRAARNTPECSSTTYQFEESLKKIAGKCVVFLLLDGPESICKLYDDLQYLSFREGGIKGDCYAVESWVILIKILDAANIPRGGFWDVTNPCLVGTHLKDISDAPTLEKLWYSMYWLLPLSEFDEFGVVVPDSRQISHFDNWSLPQQILKRVFSMYKLNPRQPPGFNAYCRAIVGRCHHLMAEWGWWKGSSLIGTLFDIFAEHDLANLRNEEVYTSPRFLLELHTQPSLAVELEDRCFHLFLKIAALQIKHFAQIGDVNSIRNLVPRILPNHNREYPKEKAIQERDLASLRNQHDLLSTLYWASPTEQRPSISLLQNLVIADRSHWAACLINLRAWQNLSRFVVTSTEGSEAYEPLRGWHSSMMRVLIQSYQRTEKDARQQADKIQDISEREITENVLANKKATAGQIRDFFNAWKSILELVNDIEMLKAVADFDLLRRALGLHLNESCSSITECILRECQIGFVSYLKKVNELCDTDCLAATSNVKSLQVRLIEPLCKQTLSTVRLLARRYIETDHYNSTRILSVEEFVVSWAYLVYYAARVRHKPFINFLVHGENAVFENRERYRIANDYWPFFLALLLKLGNLDELKVPGFDIGKEWFLAITEPNPLQNQQVSTRLKSSLSKQLQESGHYFLVGLDLSKSTCLSLARSTIRKMKSILLRNATQAEIGMPREKAERLFSEILEEMMKSAQRYLEAMDPNTEAHTRYLAQIQPIIRDIRCYANDFRPLIDFFNRPSLHYWPDHSDPGLVSAGLRSYALRIHGNQKSTSSELFYYLYNDWRNAIVSDKICDHQNAIKSAMRQWQFANYMFREFVPAVLQVGVDTKGGWLLCSTYLPTISDTIINIRNRRDDNSPAILELTTNLLKLIMKAIAEVTPRHQVGVGGVPASHRGLLSVVLSFYFAIKCFVEDYADHEYVRTDVPPSAAQSKTLTELRHAMTQLDEFVDQIRKWFADPTWEFWPPDDEEEREVEMGDFGDEFVSRFKLDIQTSFSFRDATGFDVVVRGRGQESQVQTTRRLGEVIKKNFLPDPYFENRFFGFGATGGYPLV